MTIEVKKKIDEKTEGLIRRFDQVIRQSGLIPNVKGGRFYIKKKSRKMKRMEALRRKTFQEKLKYLRKTGQIKEPERKYAFRKTH